MEGTTHPTRSQRSQLRETFVQVACHPLSSPLCAKSVGYLQELPNSISRQCFIPCAFFSNSYPPKGLALDLGGILPTFQDQEIWLTTTEPARLEPVLRNKRGRDSERPMHRDEEWPPLATTRESPRTETKTQHSQR